VISRRLVEAHHGELTVTDTAAQITIPARRT
jgi:signal transduction histidine kinase